MGELEGVVGADEEESKLTLAGAFLGINLTRLRPDLALVCKVFAKLVVTG